MWKTLGWNKFARRKAPSWSPDQTGGFNHWAEAAAAEYLQRQGLQLKQRNYRCRSGEIDLIMSHRDCDLIFVEVRYRRQNRYGSPMETVDRNKQRKLIKAAQHYLQRHGNVDRLSCRFDVVAVELDSKSAQATPYIQWVANAFCA